LIGDSVDEWQYQKTPWENLCVNGFLMEGASLKEKLCIYWQAKTIREMAVVKKRY
jgi:hypothetical protein